MDLAGSNAGTLYGRGIYLAEASSKSDEYCAEASWRTWGKYCMLLCRVCFGEFHLTNELADDNAAIRVLHDTGHNLGGGRGIRVDEHDELCARVE